MKIASICSKMLTKYTFNNKNNQTFIPYISQSKDINSEWNGL